MDALTIMTGVLAIATFALAAISASSVIETRRMHTQEMKIRLLDEINEWVLDIHRSTTEIPLPILQSGQTPQSRQAVLLEYQVHVVSRLDVAFGKSEYMKTVAVRVFTEDLGDDIDQLWRVLITYMSLKLKSIGFPQYKDYFGGSAAKVVEVADQATSKPEQLDDLLKKTNDDLMKRMAELSKRIGDIKVSLLPS